VAFNIRMGLPEPIFRIDEGDRHPEVGGVIRRRVPTRTGADDH